MLTETNHSLMTVRSFSFPIQILNPSFAYNMQREGLHNARALRTAQKLLLSFNGDVILWPNLLLDVVSAISSVLNIKKGRFKKQNWS